MKLQDAISGRRSVREYADEAVDEPTYPPIDRGRHIGAERRQPAALDVYGRARSQSARSHFARSEGAHARDMIFVSPDESGRVTKLNVREGDEVKTGEQLYSVDDDLQQANLNQNRATLANAQQSY